MKLIHAILFTILIVFVGGIASSLLKIPWLMYLLLAGISIWIYIDSKKVETEKYKSFWGLPPINLALMNLLFMAIVLPAYLWTKYRIQHNMLPIREEFKNDKQGVNSKDGQKI